MTVNVNPPPTEARAEQEGNARPVRAGDPDTLDNGMEYPPNWVIEYQGQRAIEATAKPAETPALNPTGVECMSEKDLEDWFSYYVPDAGHAEKFEAIRAAGKALAQLISDSTPPSA